MSVTALTPLEICELIHMAVEGKSNVDIGKRFTIAVSTVTAYRKRVYGELRVANMVELTRLCTATGIVVPPGVQPNFERSLLIYNIIRRSRRTERPAALTAGTPVLVLLGGTVTSDEAAIETLSRERLTIAFLKTNGATLLPSGGRSLPGRS